MCEKLNAIKAWALENYASSYGASVLVECYSNEELDAEFESLEEAIKFAKLKDEQESNAAWSGPGGPSE